MEKGHFRYNFRSPKFRPIPGKFGFVAQMNENRLTNRRQPQEMSHLEQPFDNAKFNFTKINEERESIFTLDYANNDDDDDDYVIINVSPIDFCNSLLVPRLKAKLPQVLTPDSIFKAMSVIALSNSPDLRAGFNSLCAHASVNHQHWHIMYLSGPTRLALETIPVERLASDCYEISSRNYPAEGFAFQAALNGNPDIGNELIRVSKSVHRLTGFFTSRNIAHNVYVTRGKNFERSDEAEYGAIRVFVWARESVFGPKYSGSAFQVAVCELSGQILCYEDERYENLTEKDVVEALSGACNNVKANITSKVIELFNHDH